MVSSDQLFASECMTEEGQAGFGRPESPTQPPKRTDKLFFFLPPGLTWSHKLRGAQQLFFLFFCSFLRPLRPSARDRLVRGIAIRSVIVDNGGPPCSLPTRRLRLWRRRVCLFAIASDEGGRVLLILTLCEKKHAKKTTCP